MKSAHPEHPAEKPSVSNLDIWLADEYKRNLEQKELINKLTERVNSLEILTKSLTAEVERLSKNENGNGVTPESNKEYPYSSAIKKG